MDEKDFQELLAEIDSMTIEEYNNYHKKAVQMKKSGLFLNENFDELSETDYTTLKEPVVGTFSTEAILGINSEFSATYDMIVDEPIANMEIRGEKICPEAA